MRTRSMAKVEEASTSNNSLTAGEDNVAAFNLATDRTSDSISRTPFMPESTETARQHNLHLRKMRYAEQARLTKPEKPVREVQNAKPLVELQFTRTPSVSPPPATSGHGIKNGSQEDLNRAATRYAAKLVKRQGISGPEAIEKTQTLTGVRATSNSAVNWQVNHGRNLN
jgi:hypothetical protein